MTIIDRYILKGLLINYGVALAVMVSLYIVLDLFVNMDEFTEAGFAVPAVLRNIFSYYWPNVFLYFAQLSSIITLFACLATIARMRRLNELTAVLASGVSLYRIARPVIAFGIVTTGLLVVDTEWVVPSVAHLLARDHDDVGGQRTYEVLFLRDRDEKLVSAGRFDPSAEHLERLLVLTRDANGTVVATLEADRAVWEPPGEGRPHGRWRLERARRIERVEEAAALGPRETKRVTYPTYYESDLSPEVIQLRQSEGWVGYLSLAELNRLKERQPTNLASIIQTIHARRTAPIVSIVLLLLGLPFFLDRAPANVLSDAARCMAVCGMCYAATFVSQGLRPETASALPAWIPIFVFGTLAVVLIDRVRT